MGNICGKEAETDNEEPDDLVTKPLFEKKVDPKELCFNDQTDKLLVKKDFIEGQQFLIDNCKNCQILLFDWTEQVMIDHCEDCIMFIPPCASSVFLRNCKNCKIAVACQQLRTRECDNVEFNILCQTPPSIESSTNLRFSCWGFNYFSLNAHLKAAALDPWENKCDQIYDFTPTDSKEKTKKNWSFMTENESKKLEETFIKLLENREEISLITDDCVVPPTRPEPEGCYLYFIISDFEDAYLTLRTLLDMEDFFILQTAVRKLTKKQYTMLDYNCESIVGFKCYSKLPEGEDKLKGSFTIRSQALLDTFFIHWAPKMN